MVVYLLRSRALDGNLLYVKCPIFRVHVYYVLLLHNVLHKITGAYIPQRLGRTVRFVTNAPNTFRNGATGAREHDVRVLLMREEDGERGREGPYEGEGEGKSNRCRRCRRRRLGEEKRDSIN